MESLITSITDSENSVLEEILLGEGSGALNDIEFLTRIADEQKVTSYVQSSIIQLYLRYMNRSSVINDNPFDSVYISKLKPDILEINDLIEVKKYYSIEDKSEDIFFDDGLD